MIYFSDVIVIATDSSIKLLWDAVGEPEEIEKYEIYYEFDTEKAKVSTKRKIFELPFLPPKTTVKFRITPRGINGQLGCAKHVVAKTSEMYISLDKQVNA